jgi:hypothetical protein
VATFRTLVTTALAVAVGFAWNTAIVDLSQLLLPEPHYRVLAAFVWALLLTIAAVLVIMKLGNAVPYEVPHIPEE